MGRKGGVKIEPNKLDRKRFNRKVPLLSKNWKLDGEMEDKRINRFGT